MRVFSRCVSGEARRSSEAVRRASNVSKADNGHLGRRRVWCGEERQRRAARHAAPDVRYPPPERGVHYPENKDSPKAGEGAV